MHVTQSHQQSMQFSFLFLLTHLRHDGRNCHTHSSWLHTSVLVMLNHSPTARNLSSTPFRIVEVWEYATTTPNMSMSSFPVLSVCRVSLPLVHFVSCPTRSRIAHRKDVKEMCKMTAQLCSGRPVKNEESMRVLEDFTGVPQRSINVYTSCN